jgi:predicted dehydrogenase
MKLKVGIVGASFAKAAYLPAFQHIDSAEVIAIASSRLLSAKNCAEEFNIPNYYDDWKKMIDNHNFDLICIATPTDLHAPISIYALENGCHVLAEKPTAMNENEARKMLNTAVKNNKLHMIDHELRFNPNRKKIKDLISANKLGKIQHVNITNISNGWLDPSSRPEDDWWSLSERGGGRMGANGSHQIDLLRWWFGEVKSVFGQSLTIVKDRTDKKSNNRWIATADDLSYFSLEMVNGILANVFISGVASHALGNKTQIFGTEGTIILEDKNEEIFFAKRNEEFQKLFIEDPNKSLEGINKGIWNVSVVSLLQELVAAIKEKRILSQGSTFEDGLKNQIILDAVKESTIKRKWINL